MAMTKCKECGNEVSDSASTCPKCGAKLPNMPGVIMGIRVVLITGIVLYMFSAFSEDGIGGIFNKIFGSPSYAVTYYVAGSASDASLTYANERGETEQEDVTLPWQKTFHMRPDSFVSISAWDQESDGDLTVRITVDGNEFKRAGPSGDALVYGTCCKQQ